MHIIHKNSKKLEPIVESEKKFRESAVVIQAFYRSSKCRKKVKRFSELPLDVWRIILRKMCIKNLTFDRFERNIFRNMVVYSWKPRNKFIKYKMKILGIISLYPTYFRLDVVKESIYLLHRLLNGNFNYIQKLLLNTFAERLEYYLYTVKLYKHEIQFYNYFL